MNTDEKSLLLAFSGAETSHSALDYGVWLASQIRVPVTLLGIVEKPIKQKQVERVIETVSENLGNIGIPHNAHLVSGKCRTVICQEAEAGRHLTVFGPFDRPKLRRWLRGRSFRRILEEIDTPVLYVKQSKPQIRNILVCMGGLGYAKSAENLALALAKSLNAEVTFFHVVEPISFDYPIAQEIQNDWEDILKTNTPQGQNLRDAIAQAQNMEVPASLQVRQGAIIHEILAQIRSNQYDLIVMGSASSSANLRHLFMPNVTAEIAETVECPVLVAKLGQDWIF